MPHKYCPHLGGFPSEGVVCKKCYPDTITTNNSPMTAEQDEKCPKCGRKGGCQNHFDDGYAQGRASMEAELAKVRKALENLIEVFCLRDSHNISYPHPGDPHLEEFCPKCIRDKALEKAQEALKGVQR